MDRHQEDNTQVMGANKIMSQPDRVANICSNLREVSYGIRGEN